MNKGSGMRSGEGDKGKRNQKLKCKNQNFGIPTTSGYYFERSLRSLHSVGMTTRSEKGKVEKGKNTMKKSKIRSMTPQINLRC